MDLVHVHSPQRVQGVTSLASHMANTRLAPIPSCSPFFTRCSVGSGQYEDPLLCMGCLREQTHGALSRRARVNSGCARAPNTGMTGNLGSYGGVTEEEFEISRRDCDSDYHDMIADLGEVENRCSATSGVIETDTNWKHFAGVLWRCGFCGSRLVACMCTDFWSVWPQYARGLCLIRIKLEYEYE